MPHKIVISAWRWLGRPTSLPAFVRRAAAGSRSGRRRRRSSAEVLGSPHAAPAGLIGTKSVPVSLEGVGYPSTPGTYTDAQTASWLRVANAVHSADGRVFVQLQHSGRISHPSLLPDNAGRPGRPSPMRACWIRNAARTRDPRNRIVAQFQRGAEMVKCACAGFDGVEVRGANGYIID